MSNNIIKARLTRIMPAAVILALVLTLCAPFAGVTLADIPDPATIEIESVKVYRHMLDANDTLAVVRYNIQFANSTDQPAEPINETFVFNWTDSNDCDLANVTAYPFQNAGYSVGVVSFYFAANNTCGNESAPTWGDLGNISVVGTDLFDTPPMDWHILTSDDFTEYVAPADIREDLRQHIITTAMILSIDWNKYWLDAGAEGRQVDLLQFVSPSYTVLSTTGESYFTLAIDNLYDMCPLAFAYQITDPSYTDQTHPKTLETDYETQFDDTSIGQFKEGLNEISGGMGEQVIGNFLAVVMCVIIVGVCSVKFAKPQAGLLLGFPIVLFMTRAGMSDMWLMMVVVMFAVIIIAYKMLFKPSAG